MTRLSLEHVRERPVTFIDDVAGPSVCVFGCNVYRAAVCVDKRRYDLEFTESVAIQLRAFGFQAGRTFMVQKPAQEKNAMWRVRETTRPGRR